MWWEKQDLNRRILAATNLQSALLDQTLAISPVMVRSTGFEPVIFGLSIRCSTN